MAESFKNLPRPGDAAIQKEPSERDFFDLTVEPQSEKNRGESTIGLSNTSNISNKTINVAPSRALVDKPTSNTGDVRQTFFVGRSHLEQLRDYVHAQYAQGNYLDSQK